MSSRLLIARLRELPRLGKALQVFLDPLHGQRPVFPDRHLSGI